MKYYIISARGITYRLIRHKGILFEDRGQWYVTHHCEGGVKLETLEQFLAPGREVLGKEAHECVDAHQIRAYYADHKNDEFKSLTNNCEHYVNRFRKQNGETVAVSSPQVAVIIGILLAVAGLAVAYKFKWL